MTLEFIIIYQPREDEPILVVLRDRLRVVLEANLNDVEEEALARMVLTSFERLQPANADGTIRRVMGFSLELPEETTSIREVVKEFSDALMADPIEHAVKCEDPLLRSELAARADELFALEMKLRRVLSIIYLHADPDADPYDLLTEETVQPMAKDKPQKDHMKVAAENQFFHLTFGQYVGLNQRPAIKDLGALIRNEATYEAFRTELMRQPIEHEDDAVFLASLKQRMDVIEKMRNCVAHNRRPSQKWTNDYLNALPLVNQALDDYLEALAVDWRDSFDTGPLEDQYAHAALTYALEHADWDEAAHKVHLETADGNSITINNREELVRQLRSICSDEWHSHASRIDGEYVGICDDATWVSEALDEYQEQLEKVFPNEKD
jgi:hypothetical protein